MNSTSSDELLVVLCHHHLLDIRNRFIARRPFRPTREEAHAQLQIVERLFELAAGAAATRNMKKSKIQPVVQVVEELRQLLKGDPDDTSGLA